MVQAEPTSSESNRGSATVVIVAPHTSSVTRRLQQEIEALGFAVQIESRPFAERPELELSTRGAVAAIEVSTVSPGNIVLYVLEPNTARIIRQELPIEAPNDPTATELVATRAVELLRAARLEVTPTSKPRPALPKPSASRSGSASALAATPNDRAQAKLREPELLLGVAPGLFYVPHFSAGLSFGASVTYIGVRNLGWCGSFTLAPSPARMQIADVGRIAAYPTSFRVGSVFQAVRSEPIGLRFGAGLEWTQVKFTGQAAAPNTSSSVSQSTFAPWLSFATSIRLSAQFQLLTTVASSWALPRTIVRYAGQELRDWGRPTLSGSLALEWRSL